MFELFAKDKITLIKSDGKRFENISANVNAALETISILDVSLPIEEGDKMLRILPNNLEEYYTVLERGYSKGLMSIPERYKVKVRKETNQNNKEAIPTISVGNNSRVNIHSTDNSINIQINENNVFEELKKTIEKNISDNDEKAMLISKVEELKNTQNTKKFSECYKEFIALAADHITILAPFIPFLTQSLIT